MRFSLWIAASLSLLLGACTTSRPLPKWEKPLARSRTQIVRTTAYTHSESDHIRYGNKSALGTPLRCGPDFHSAAADWARWPAGTIFRMRSTGEIFVVDDYGWALTGRNTIDLYKPTRAAMNAWGVRRETIDILRWGDPWASYQKLKPAAGKHRHLAQMVRDIRRFYGSPQPPRSPAHAQQELIALGIAR